MVGFQWFKNKGFRLIICYTYLICVCGNWHTTLRLSRMGVQARSSNDRLRTVWTPEMDRYFINLMLEQASNGNKLDDNLFSKRAWKHMILLFNAKFKFQYEKDVLKNRHKSLRNLYRAIKNLLDQPGFYWDETRQMVIADNNAWEAYIQVQCSISNLYC